ncbi:hypothetical protein [Litchfieldia alkalitelluris]|uniref:hypothetical protein n=1 Tax=Litchfieldia alkalitelluris TaxID=304268 RepID=UPI0009980350|nr:hypothetical protein [Litchfieldia alkalitelluris]
MALDIVINNDYKITSDSLNVIINRSITIDPTKSPRWKEGMATEIREEWREVAYFPNIIQAADWLMNQHIRDSRANTLLDLVDEIKRFEREITAKLTR